MHDEDICECIIRNKRRRQGNISKVASRYGVFSFSSISTMQHFTPGRDYYYDRKYLRVGSKW